MREHIREILELCMHMIVNDFRLCGLEDQVKKQIRELTLEWERCREEAAKKNVEIGGLKVLFYAVLWTVEMAESNSKRHGKTPCHYLKMALDHGNIGNWARSMWGTDTKPRGNKRGT